MIVPRHRAVKDVLNSLRSNPVTSILGPRQCGKTTLAGFVAARRKRVELFDLEDPTAVARLQSPMFTLERLRGLVVIDEVQRMPELFEVLRVLADRPRTPARFLLLGSASPRLVRATSESLAGRVGFFDLGGFTLAEIGFERIRRLWLRGGFPRSYLARNDRESSKWRSDFIRTFLERDIPVLGLRLPATTLRRFWTMAAHYHGCVWNGAEVGRSLGVTGNTIRNYLDVLGGAYVVRVLAPWHQNLKKRQVKSPKVYVRDSGLLHRLLGVDTWPQLEGNPKFGASWEGLVVEEALRIRPQANAYFWATHQGAELDLLLMEGGKRFGIECKISDAPRMTKSMHVALSDLGLNRLWVVHPGAADYDLGKRVRAVSLATFSAELVRG